MPNWCYASYAIKHKDEKKVEELARKLEEWTSKGFVENDFGHNWLGNIVGFSGIDKWDALREKFVNETPCRGILYDIDVYKDTLQFHTETAWSPKNEMWVLLCKKYLPGAEIIYTAEECSNGIFQTNDPSMKSTYYIDFYGEDETDPVYQAYWEEIGDDSYEVTESQIRRFLQKALKTKESDIKKLFERADDIDDLSIHEWDFIPLDEVA